MNFFRLNMRNPELFLTIYFAAIFCCFELCIAIDAFLKGLFDFPAVYKPLLVFADVEN